MPDKRDMHKAKSHRNSKSTKQQQQHAATTHNASQGSVATATTTTMTQMAEPEEALTPDLRGKKNKSRR